MDLALEITGDTRFSDLQIIPPGLATGDSLQSALIISLFTDRRANDDDPLSLDESRRGWWADSFLVNRNDKYGSRLWLLRRAKVNTSTLVRAREYVLEATRWLIEDSVASRIDVTTDFMAGRNDVMLITIDVVRPTGSETFNFEHVWNDI